MKEGERGAEVGRGRRMADGEGGREVGGPTLSLLTGSTSSSVGRKGG